jgi:hypothetical protein
MPAECGAQRRPERDTHEGRSGRPDPGRPDEHRSVTVTVGVTASFNCSTHLGHVSVVNLHGEALFTRCRRHGEGHHLRTSQERRLDDCPGRTESHDWHVHAEKVAGSRSLGRPCDIPRRSLDRHVSRCSRTARHDRPRIPGNRFPHEPSGATHLPHAGSSTRTRRRRPSGGHSGVWRDDHPCGVVGTDTSPVRVTCAAAWWNRRRGQSPRTQPTRAQAFTGTARCSRIRRPAWPSRSEPRTMSPSSLPGARR